MLGEAEVRRGGGGLQAHPGIAAAALGAEQGLVSQLDSVLPAQRLGLVADEGHGGKAYRAADAQQSAVVELEGRIGHDAADALGQLGGAASVGVAGHGQEFLTTPAHHIVGLAHQLLQPAAELDQHRIAGGMAVLVVHALEMVHVDQEEQRVAVGRRRVRVQLGLAHAAQAGGQRGVDVFGQEAAVVQACQRVADAGAFQHARLLGQGQRKPFQLGGAFGHQVLELLLALAQPAGAQMHDQHHAGEDQQRGEHAEPPGLVPGRQHMQRQAQLLLGPGAVPVGAAQQQFVVTRWQVVVAELALAGVELRPLLVQALELVGVAVALGRRVVERSDFGGQAVGVGGNLERTGRQCGQLLRVQPFRTHAQGGEHHRRLVGPGLELLGADDGHAARTAKQQLAGIGARGRARPVGQELDALGAAQALRLQRGGVDAREAVVGAGPDKAAAVFQQRVDVLVRHALGLADMAEAQRLGAALEDVDATAIGADPEALLAVGIERGDEAGREAVRPRRFGHDALHSATGGKEAVQSHAGTDPEAAARPSRQREDALVAQLPHRLGQHHAGAPVHQVQRPKAVGLATDPQGVAISQQGPGGGVRIAPGQGDPAHLAAVATGAVQAALGADEDRAIGRLLQGHHDVLRQRGLGLGGIGLEPGDAGTAGVDDLDAALVRAQPDATIRRGQDPADLVGQRDLVAMQVGAGRRAIHGQHGALAGVVPAQAAVGGHPQQARTVAVERADRVVGQADGQRRLVRDRPAAQRGRVDGHDAMAQGAEPDLARPHFVDRHHLLHLQGRQARQRHVQGLGVAGIGVDDEGAMLQRAYPQPPGGIFGQRLRLRLTALRRQDKGDKSPGIRWAVEQATLGANPEAALAVLHHGRHAAAWRIGAGGRQDPAQGAVLRVQVVQPAFAGDPEAAGAIFGNGAHADMRQAIGAGGIADEVVGGRLITGQSRAIGAHPQPALAVAVQRLHIAVGQRAGALAVGLVDAETVTVPAGQATQGANPQIARTVFGHRRGDLVGQAVVLAQMTKAQLGQLRPALRSGLRRLRGRLRARMGGQQQSYPQHSAGGQRAQPGSQQGYGRGWV